MARPPSPLDDLDLYRAVGGIDGCRRLSTAFYARVEHDPVLRPIFPSTFRWAIESFALFMAQYLGGPCDYSKRRWWLSLRELHLRFGIGQRERDAWLSDMLMALDDVSIDEPVRGALVAFFEQSSARLVNRGDAPRTTQDRSGPPTDRIHLAMAERWDELRAVEEVVAAVRSGDADRAIELAEGSILKACFDRDRATLLSLLVLMGGSDSGAMVEYVHRKLLHDPALARESYSRGRSLLHGVAAGGSLTTVEMLLRLGADPNATDHGGHAPLYCVANERGVDGGGGVVRTLVRAGADVDAHGGVKRCTPLHMAARRGNVQVAGALLDCGADLEARDSLGDTPLRRSVNCGKLEVAALLLSRGADIHSRGSRGLTPSASARTTVMRQLMEPYAEAER